MIHTPDYSTLLDKELPNLTETVNILDIREKTGVPIMAIEKYLISHGYAEAKQFKKVNNASR